MLFQYELLDALSAVVREGSFEGGAQHLNITQSAISQRIKLLEARSGARLVVRGKPCIATELGMELCRHIDRVLMMESDLARRLTLENDSSGVPITVRIAVNADSLGTWFPEVVAQATNDLNLRFDIAAVDQDSTFNLLRSADALAAITSESRPLTGFRRTSLGMLSYVAVASRKFYDCHFREGVTLTSLCKSPCIIYDRQDMIPQNWVLQELGEHVPLSRHLVPSSNGYIRTCASGGGWGLIPQDIAKPGITAGDFVELIPNSPVSVPLFWHHGYECGETMRKLTDIVVNAASSYLEQTAESS